MDKALIKAIKSITIGVLVFFLVIIAYMAMIVPIARRYMHMSWLPLSFNQSVTTSSGSAGLATPEIGGYPMMGTTSERDNIKSMPPFYYGGDAVNLTDNYQQKIISTGNLDLQVTSISDANTQIQKITNDLKGFVQNSNVSEDQQGKKYGYLTLRIPSDKFTEAMNMFKGLAVKVNNENISGQDVTQEYVDLEAQLKQQQSVEIQYLEILKKAVKVEEILMVQDRLQQTQREIESLKARLTYLNNQVSYSIINVNLSEQPKLEVPINKYDWQEVLRNSIRSLVNLLQNFVSFVIIVIVVAIGLIPYLAFVGLLVWLGAKAYGKYNKRK